MSAQNMMFDHDFQYSLDQADRRREAAHNQALAEAAEQHDRVREAAEAAIKNAAEKAELDLRKKEEQAELERKMKEVEDLRKMQEKQRRELERMRKAAEEEKKKAAEEEKAQRQREKEKEKAKQEAERRRAQAAAEEEEEERREQAERDAAAQVILKREADAKAKKLAAQEAAKKVQEEQRAPTQPPNPFARKPDTAHSTQAPRPSQPAQPTNGVATTDPSREQAHERYLQVHKNMKEFRKWMEEQKKTNANLKNAMGDGRREIRKNVGQLTGDSKKNAEKRENIVKILINGATFPEPKTDVSMFLFDAQPSSTQTQVPALLIYLINVFIKALMRQFVGEGGVKLSMGNPLGIVASAIFAKPELQWNGRSMIDMLIAKYHKVCPVLFGIYGPEDTDAGKMRIGWRKVFDGRRSTWISAQDHADRMLGFGAGYAALSLRNYDRSKLLNPYPPWHFWVAASTIVNTPAGQIQPSHCYVLRALFAGNEQRILDFFGDFAFMLLRHALIDFPKLADQKSPATQQLRVLADQMSQEKKMYLMG